MTQQIKFSPGEANVKNVLYIGEDLNYWENVKKTFEKSYSIHNFLYYHYETDRGIGYKQLFIKTYKFLPSIIYVDLSKDTVKLLKLIRLLVREVKFKNSAIVGLVDAKKGITEALSANCDFVHIKCGELHDVVYGPIRLVYPHVAKEPKFARAITEEKSEILYPARVGFMTSEFFHVETNAKLNQSTKYKFTTSISKKYLPSNNFSAEEILNPEGNYYNTRHVFKLKPDYFDKPDLLVKVEELKEKGKKFNVDVESIEEAEREYLNGLELAKKSFEKYVEDNREDGFEKNVRIMVCDEEYQILLQTEEDLSSSPYAYRLSSSFTADVEELKNFKPQIIALEFKEEVSDENEEEDETIDDVEASQTDNEESGEEPVKNKKDKWLKDIESEEKQKQEDKKRSINLDQVKLLVDKINCIEKYRPVIIVFNSLYSSENLQQFSGYNLFICNKDNINIETIAEMANIFKTKFEKTRESTLSLKFQEKRSSDPKKYKNLKISDLKEKRFYLSKRNPLSVGKIHHPITVIGLSESEVWFKCQDELTYGTFEIESPANLMMTLVFDRDTGGLITNINGENCYQGIFHCFDEDEKKEIRKKVNQIFFTDLINQRKIESMEYEKITKEALDKKLNELEEMKKLLEMAEIKKTSNG